MVRNNVIIKMEGITKSFPGVIALKDVNFSLNKGEVHALVGENGAGKSTLMKILVGIFPPSEGRIYVDSKPVNIESPLHAKKLGISMIHQELMLAESLSAAENIFLGNLPKRRFLRTVNWQQVRLRAQKILTQLGVQLDINTPVYRLGIAQRQMIEIAKALVLNAKVFIFDEPSSFLNREELKILFGLIRSLKEKGCGVIYISHRLEEIFQIADRVTVLKDGKVMGTFLITEVDKEKL
ncbi:sugar ABC transporter ATP-binding protein, partial [Candidatus Aerophobetes bacterium]|nr:sugar ABC transporter ATP-binding protein [Candidatus Aerophobetes bacterium]